jgi:penicillin-binding protein 3
MKKRFLFFSILFLFLLLSACSKKDDIVKPQDVFDTYVKHWQKGEYDKLYDMHTEQSNELYSKEEFVERLGKIYHDLEITDLKVSFKAPSEEISEETTEVTIPFTVSMNSMAGPIEFDHEANMIKVTDDEEEKEHWLIEWNHEFIFEGMQPDQKVGIETVPGSRGEILDRNGNGLAINGEVIEVGLIPERIEGQENEVKSKLAGYLNLTVDEIEQKLNASWVQPHYYVPIKSVPNTQVELIEKIEQIQGVQTRKVSGRVYPIGEAAAHLIGYIGEITAEELDEMEGYSPGDYIGKRGLEQILEDRLRAEDGVKIYLENPDQTRITVAEKPVKNGETVQLTIDSNFQQEMLKKFNGNAGTAVAIHPKTGETLAIVSSPSFDPNTYMFMSASEKEELENNPLKPTVNRFVLPHTPGSVMKLYTAVIGLETGKIKPDKERNITGKQWQKDDTWGGYYVTRVSDPGRPVNLEDAMVLSDNIYFAQTALEIGEKDYIAGLKKFGFGEKIPYSYALQPSQISNEGGLSEEILLADTAYGQGEVQTNIVHLALSYGAILNKGNLIKPVLLAEEDQSQIWKESVVSPNHADLIADYLRKVITQGTGKPANMSDLPLSGKTGTAEIAKASQGEQGMENSFFVAYNTNEQDLLIAMMMEGTQELGGTKVVVEAVKNLFAEFKK